MSNLFSRLSLRGNIVTAAMAAFLLVACGGDGNNAGDPEPSAEADFVVDTFGDLSVCTDKREGATAYVKDEDNAYICTNGGWTIDTNADTRKKSSNSKDDANSSNSKDKVKSSSSRCEDCKEDANSDSGKDKVKSSSSVCEDSSSSRHCEDCKDEAISSNKDDVKSSSSSVALATPCKTETEDNCEYGELVDTRDGQTYKTVRIGDQVWMAENLNNKVDSSWCGGRTDYNEGDCSKYGRLYTWAAAVGKSDEDCGYGKTCGLSGKVRGVCPEGWHLPDTTEWRQLIAAVGGKSTAGKILKSQTGWKAYNGTSGNGTDVYGFSAFPAGNRNLNGSVLDEDESVTFWSATESSSDYAYLMDLYYDNEFAYLGILFKNFAFSVRCIQD